MNNSLRISKNIKGGKMKKDKKDNDNIKCDVESCKFNDCGEKCCTLKEIKVSCSCEPCDACKKETICDSFKEKENDSK